MGAAIAEYLNSFAAPHFPSSALPCYLIAPSKAPCSLLCPGKLGSDPKFGVDIICIYILHRKPSQPPLLLPRLLCTYLSILGPYFWLPFCLLQFVGRFVFVHRIRNRQAY